MSLKRRDLLQKFLNLYLHKGDINLIHMILRYAGSDVGHEILFFLNECAKHIVSIPRFSQIQKIALRYSGNYNGFQMGILRGCLVSIFYHPVRDRDLEIERLYHLYQPDLYEIALRLHRRRFKMDYVLYFNIRRKSFRVLAPPFATKNDICEVFGEFSPRLQFSR